MTTQALQETVQWVNPLENAEIRSPFESWEEWKAVWDKALARGDVLALLGHLHYIFGISGGYRPAILHLLEVADGYRYGSKLKGSRTNHIYTFDRRRGGYSSRAWSGWQAVMQKAWQLLCDNFFTDVSHPGDGPFTSWEGFTMEEEMFKKHIWFFDPIRQPENIPYGRNSDKYDGIALKFLHKFVSTAWYFWSLHQHGPFDEDKKLQQIIYEYRPRLVEILNAINGLDFLLTRRGIIERDNNRPELQIDDATIAKLEELATDSGARTVETANWQGSHSARILLALRSAMKENERQECIVEAKQKEVEEKKRQERIAEAEQKAKDAQRELAEASGKK